MDSGYWQVVAEDEEYEILALLTPYGKRWCKVITMGYLNAAPKAVSMIIKTQMEWDTLAKECGLKNIASKITVDDVLLYVCTAKQLLSYFRAFLDILKHQQYTLKPKNCKLFQDRCDFLGMYVAAGGTKPSNPKNEVFANLYQPNTRGDIRMIIGIFGLYSQLFPLYDLDIRPWRYIFSKYPQAGKFSKGRRCN